MVDSTTYWRTMWALWGIGIAVALLGAALGSIAIAVPGMALLFVGIFVLKMWMWQKAYEGKPEA